ncbi:cell division protein SepF [Streptococcus cristatus]|uniref:cell division protein SepF n=1 Tax=Streptococcus cristatus TaxID=45634 RepID=UPI0011E89655|nr:cell division protein SepF [Streptococcus cristatus]
MSFKDNFNKFIEYFTEDGEKSDLPVQPLDEPDSVLKQAEVEPVPAASAKENARTRSASSQVQQKPATENITRLHARQQELAQHRVKSSEKVTIDVRYPKKYEEATEVVDLLVANESILIDFQYMTEVQARRCLDYLDGARYVLAGNLRKVASTMYLLTPINVVVNVEDIRLPNDVDLSEYDFDMKRSR